MFKVGDTIEVVIPNLFNRDSIHVGDRGEIKEIIGSTLVIYFPNADIEQIVSDGSHHHIKLVEEANEKILSIDIAHNTTEDAKEDVIDKISFKVGDKVALPTTKTYFSNETTADSSIIKNAKRIGQDYLYITKIYREGEKSYCLNKNCYVLDTKKGSNDGDFFAYEDLKPYVSTSTKPNTKPIVHEDNEYYKVTYIVNEPYVIVFLTDKELNKTVKGIAKCTPDDEFDVDTGIKIAFLKAEIKISDYFTTLLRKELNQYA